jgi:hypothetical protein
MVTQPAPAPLETKGTCPERPASAGANREEVDDRRKQ